MINILYCGNSYVFDGVLTSMLSIFKRTKTKEAFNFIILTMDVSYLKPNYTVINKEMIDFLDEVAKKYNPLNSVKSFDVTDLYVSEFKGSPNENCYCSPYTLIRLFADKIDVIPDKFLYLDCDIMFNKDIELLYNIDIDNYEYAACNDHYGKFLINPRYINAGVILFNLKKCKENGLFDKARAWIKKKHLPFADQSAIIRSTTKFKLLPQYFNNQRTMNKKTVVRHFTKRLYYFPYPHTDNIKQWHIFKVHRVLKYNQFDDILFEYLYLSGVFQRRNEK